LDIKFLKEGGMYIGNSYIFKW